MKKFIVIYYAPASAVDQMAKASPEEMKKGMEPWMEWAKKVGSGMVDLGAPLGNGHKVTKSGAIASNSKVNGYSILQAEDMDAAVEMLKDHPHLDWAEGCEIEVYESMPLPM